MSKNILFLLLVFFISPKLFAQLEETPPKREFRGVWITTALNLDYPTVPTSQKIVLQEQFKLLLDKYQRMGFNAIFMQVRVAGDAFYPSTLVPWSKYLTGRQGKAPDDQFDPLQLMVEEAHKRGMEFHAWFNPFRATMRIAEDFLAPNHLYYTNNVWLIPYGGKYYINPGLPEARQHITDVVMEVVKKYDIDGVHFDDYFYPYPKKGEVFNDSLDYAYFGRSFSTIEDWRRQNIDDFIQQVSDSIKIAKPYVKFGVSPFGVWRNIEDDPFGSRTKAGVRCYDDLYADVMKWIRKDWIDYVVPQVYWSIGFEPADYLTLTNWWSSNTKDCHLYIGHAAYKVNNNKDEAWLDGNQIPEQIFHNRRNQIVKGSAFFRAQSVLSNQLGMKDSLNVLYREFALLPEMEKLELGSKHPPSFKKPRKKGTDKVKLKWRLAKENREKPPYYYVIYRFEREKGKTLDFDNPENILAVTPFGDYKKKYEYIDETAVTGKTYTYIIRAVNRQHSESGNSDTRTILKKERGVKRIKN